MYVVSHVHAWNGACMFVWNVLGLGTVECFINRAICVFILLQHSLEGSVEFQLSQPAASHRHSYTEHHAGG